MVTIPLKIIYIDTSTDNLGFALIDRIRHIQAANPAHTVVLMGNHEQVALDFFRNSYRDAWLSFGGANTLMAATKALDGSQSLTADRRLVLDRQASLIAWMRARPLSYVAGKICFVHARLDLTLANPVKDTPDHSLLWLRAKYWYGADIDTVTFASNPLKASIVSGHTPTGMVFGRYASQAGVPQQPAECRSHRNPILTIRYPGEMPRYFIDGGVGAGNQDLLGNIGVFDSETGLLIDKFEDD